MKILLAFMLMVALPGPAVAQQQKQTVQSLLAEGYTIVGVMPSSAGPGIFLQKAGTLIACFVAETPASEAIDTRYCKPVR
jgi:hypothetical protein